MALTQTDLDNLDAAIATGELEVESQGRRVKYRSIADLIDARKHIASMLAESSTTTKPRAAYRVNFSTQRGD
jgi:hypothetical protein